MLSAIFTGASYLSLGSITISSLPCQSLLLPLTAVLEAAIAAVFEHLRNLIIIEIDEPDFGTYWRKIVVAARQEAEGEEIPAPDCKDIEEWDTEFVDGILWDVDYDDEHLYAALLLKKHRY